VSFWIEWILAGVYVLLGPVAWVAFAFGMVKGRKRMQLLSRPHPPLPQPPPRVTILVPAKDEAPRIEQCLQSILRQDYPNFELVVIDDRSTDGTGQILHAMAARDHRMRIVHVQPGELPTGWGGKSFALHRGVEQATGQWLLFVDADVQLEPDALRAALAAAVQREFDMVSLLPQFVGQSFWENLLQPLAGAATGMMFAIALTNTNHNRTAFANGQFILVRRHVYEAVGGHAAIRGTLSEDTALARRIKDSGFRPRLGWGDGFAAVRMYESLGSIFHGWGRNFYVGSRGRPWRILTAIAFVLLCGFSAYAALGWGIYRNLHPVLAIGGWGWILAGAVHLVLMTAMLWLIYAWGHSRGGYALLFPLGGTIMLAIFSRSLVICVTGRVKWRGTAYSRSSLSAGSPDPAPFPALPPSTGSADSAAAGLHGHAR
jgi:chlorobactene glucosyltransferase